MAGEKTQCSILGVGGVEFSSKQAPLSCFDLVRMYTHVIACSAATVADNNSMATKLLSFTYKHRMLR